MMSDGDEEQVMSHENDLGVLQSVGDNNNLRQQKA